MKLSAQAIENVFLYDKEELMEMGYFEQGEFDEDDKDFRTVKKVEDESPSEAEKAGQF